MFVIESENLNLDQIYNSGQTFMWQKLIDTFDYLITHGDRIFLAKQIGKNKIEIYSDEITQQDVEDYFDIQTDYRKIINSIDCNDKYLKAAAQYASGVRILNQDFYDTGIQFIISQNNNIPRIKKIVQKMLDSYDFYRLSNLDNYKLGYRKEYLELFWNYYTEFGLNKHIDFMETRCELMTVKGIGAKVADCICLYGLGFKEAFPQDVWVKKILSKHYPNGFDFERYRKIAGVLQQYMFMYERYIDSNKKTYEV